MDKRPSQRPLREMMARPGEEPRVAVGRIASTVDHPLRRWARKIFFWFGMALLTIWAAAQFAFTFASWAQYL